MSPEITQYGAAADGPEVAAVDALVVELQTERDREGRVSIVTPLGGRP